MIASSSVNAMPVKMPDNADAIPGRPFSGAADTKRCFLKEIQNSDNKRHFHSAFRESIDVDNQALLNMHVQ